jgi:DNA-binding NarL/FixJ family response regulator
VTGKIRVLVADDETLVRDGLRAIAELEGDIEIVGDAATGGEAVQLARTLRPDVVLMDIRMPGMDGLEATRAIMREPSPPRVLVLTTFDSNEFVYQAMKAGASGFLLKDVRRGQLADAIRTAVAGDTLLAPAITRRLIEQFCRQPAPGEGTPAQLTGLTSRELQVLRLVGRGQSNATIGSTLFIAETTVKTHVAHILTKLGLADRAQAVVLAYETGLLHPGDATGALP